jgi:hypothetical protein
MTKVAIIAKAREMIEIVEFDESDSYNTIKDAIGGGTFDCVRINSLGIDIWIDDESKLMDEPTPNAFATALWLYEYGMTDYIAGDVIITGGVDSEGKTLGLTSDKALEVVEVAHDIIKRAMASSTSPEA